VAADAMKTGDKSCIGPYMAPADLAALLRQMADQVEILPPDWGATIKACHMVHRPHPLWADMADLSVTFNFHGLCPDVANLVFSTGAFE